MQLKVVKFGGSSLANGPEFQKVIDIIKADPGRRFIVTSAPGKRHDGDIKVTDLLIKYANQTIKNQDTYQVLNEIIGRYQAIADYFKLPPHALDKIKSILTDLPSHDYSDNAHLMAAFKAHGERMNARLMTLVLNHLGIKAKFIDPSVSGIVVTGKNPNDAFVKEVTYQNMKKLLPLKKQPIRLVFPGFFGFTSDGQIATFARGGSDITGSIVARGLHVHMYENFTDVDAIYTANPKIINNPVPIRKMTYREMRELSYAGFSVFNDEAIIPAIQGDVTINIKNTNNPKAPGTFIMPRHNFNEPDNLITGIAGKKNFMALYIHKYLLNAQVGFTLRLLKILVKYNVSYEHMPSGIDDLTIIINKDQLNQHKLTAIKHDVQEVLHPDDVEWIDDYAIIMVVGEGMIGKVGTLSRIIEPLAHKNIPIKMINKGASQISMMIRTRAEDADEAIRRIYNEFLE